MAAVVTLALSAAGASAAIQSPDLSISVAGNHFVNGAGQTVRLLGVDVPGTEYACEQGWGFSQDIDQPAQAAAEAAAIAAWGTTAVRIPLNEDCWLGINGQPSYRPNGDTEAQAQSDYQQVVRTFVSDLNAEGIYAILDLHWSAPGTVVADNQRPMPDDNSVAFWASVALTFENDHAVLFDLFNEPYSPAKYVDGAAAYPLSWSCWRDGGCQLPVTANGVDPGAAPKTYTAVGMQQLVDVIRANGATQPILVGGIAYANDLSGWLANEPTDPDHQLAASAHVYEMNSCSYTSCWNQELGTVARQVPLVIGEFDENQCPSAPDSWDDSLMNWADGAGVSYLAWGWYVVSASDCNYFLIDDPNGTPSAPNGVAVFEHLAALAASRTLGVGGQGLTTPGVTSPTGTTSTPSTPGTSSATSTAPADTSPTATEPSTSTESAPPPAGGPIPPPILPAPAPPPPASTTSQSPKPTTNTTKAPTSGTPATHPCVVPKLAGDSLSRARTAIRRAGCSLGKVKRPRVRSTTGLVVGSSNPRRGVHRRHGYRVVLTLRARGRTAAHR